MSVVSAVRARSAPGLLTLLSQVVPYALAAVLLATVGLMHVASRIMVVRLGYELSRLEAERVTLERENAALRLEVATLKAPARLEAEARRLKLGPPPPGSFITVR